LELSRIQREAGSNELDALSQQHLERAAVQMRQLLTLLLAAGLTAAIVEKARNTDFLLPPKGGELVPAPAGAGAGIPQAGAASVPASPPYRPPYGTPLPPSKLESRGSGGGEAKPADPKAAEKARLQKKLAEVRERNLQIYSELNEAARPSKQPRTAEERAVSQHEVDEAIKEAEVLRKQLADLETTPYGKARVYSYSDASANEIIRRARGLDEASGARVNEPSIDHVVPIEEIVEIEGWNELVLEDQQAILSRTDNLRLMEKRLNSSKGAKRWADWEAGRLFYRDEVWSRMVQIENSLRLSIREDIKFRARQRRR
jgi:hypothetical protein